MFEDSQIGCGMIQGCQMGGNLDPHDLDRHSMGGHRPALPWPGMRPWPHRPWPSVVRRGGAVDRPDGMSVARSSGRSRQVELCVQTVSRLGQGRCILSHVQSLGRRFRFRICHDPLSV